MRLLGIDPSLRSTGLAGAGWAEHIETKGKRGHERVAYIRNYLSDFLTGVDMVVIEEPPANGRGASTRPLIGLYYTITQDLWERGIPYAEVHPSTLKVYVCNNGRATKDDVMNAMLDLHPTMTFDTDDESDAYALLTMGHHYYAAHMPCCGGFGGHVMLDHNRVDQALGHVDWPESDLGRLMRDVGQD